MLTTNKFTFKGRITNRKTVTEQLNLTNEATEQELITRAYQAWGNNLNSYVSGDYFVILPLPNKQLLVCLSPFSSYQIYYQSDNNVLNMSDNLTDFSQNADINLLSINQLLTDATLYLGTNLFNHVNMVTNGQCILWQLTPTVELMSLHILSLQQKLNSAKPDLTINQADNIKVNSVSTTNAFNQLPALAQMLTQPVSALWQIQFLLHVQNNPHVQLFCGQTPALKKQTQKTIIDLNHDYIFKKPLTGSNISLIQLESTLHEQFQKELVYWNEECNLDFQAWLYLSYELPTQWAQKRLIAQANNKEIYFDYCHSVKLKQWLCIVLTKQEETTQNTTLPSSNMFSFNDDSIVNIFDAMQRLMYHGYKPVTNKLFNIVPPLSAKLLKQHSKFPTQVESFCCLSLTLDHLARHANWSLT